MKPKWQRYDRGNLGFYHNVLLLLVFIPIMIVSMVPIILGAIMYNINDYFCCKIATWWKQFTDRLY